MRYRASLPELELSHHLKCVAVESERVQGDHYLLLLGNARRSSVSSPYVSKYATSSSEDNRRRRLRWNLIQQYFEAPDFLELNRRCNATKIRRRSLDDDVRSSGLPIVRSRSLGCEDFEIVGNGVEMEGRKREYPVPKKSSINDEQQQQKIVARLVDRLLVDIYGSTYGEGSETTSSSWHPSSRRHIRPQLQRTRLEQKSTSELRVLMRSLREHVAQTGTQLVRQLRRRDYLSARRERLYDVITAHLQAHSKKRSEDTRMRFSLTPQPGESGFVQWLDAMKMVAKLQGGIPEEFRRKLWLTLSERHLEQRGVDWEQAEKICFNEWSNPDDEELGIQIVKDLHRTGCSLFCGAAGRDNQAVLRRVLLGYARWNKSVGYCQGLNVLAALILQVVDRDESEAVKVMIYLIEGLLPEGYFADNLRGLSIDMAVFRDLLRMRLPKLSKHLESLQNGFKDKATGSSYEPPLTNVFTMQWFLTLFCHCLPQDVVLRVWDLIFLEGDDVLLRTALAIWEGLSDRIMTVTSADEFYSIMGVLTREMLEFTDTNHLIKTIVSMGRLHGVTSLREKHRYNITPWARRLSDDDDSDTEDDERLAVAAAAAMFAVPGRSKKSERSSSSHAQASNPSSDRERLALDISTLKQQYAKLRERQRQAHIILSAACARQTMGPNAASQAMNHLLVGKSALVSGKNRPILRNSPSSALMARGTVKQCVIGTSPRAQSRRERQQQGVTIHWKDMKKRKDEIAESVPAATERETDEEEGSGLSAEMSSLSLTARRASSSTSGAAGLDSDSDSTSTELCDEPDRMSDLDSEELTSTSDVCPINNNNSNNNNINNNVDVDTGRLHQPKDESSSALTSSEQLQQQQTTNGNSELLEVSREETSIAEITDQIRRLSADDADFQTPLDDDRPINENSSLGLETTFESYPVAEEKLSVIDSYGKNRLLFVSSSFQSRLTEDNNYEKTSAVIECDEYKTQETRTKRECGDVITKREASFTDLDYNFLQSKLVIDKFDSSTDFDSFEYTGGGACDVKTDVISESLVPNAIKVERDKRDEANNSSETTYLTRSSYVIGHLPIAPTSFEARKPGRISPEIFVPRDKIKSTLEQSNTFLDKRDISILGSETKYSAYKFDAKHSPKTPDSFKSFDSGETMGPDSIISSVAVTPLYSDSRGIIMADKSIPSSVSSDSKTLTMRSIESDSAAKIQVETPGDKSITPLTDSLMQAKSAEPPCSSTESFCSPTKAKSEKSFSSDLQSPVSANSIKYTSGYNYKNNGIDLQKPSMEISAITSPFYPISNPNKKTPSPYNGDKSKAIKDSGDLSDFRGISQEQDTNHFLETKTLTQAFDVESKTITQAFDVSQFTTSDDNGFNLSTDDETFKSLPTKLYTYDVDNNGKIKNDNKLPEKNFGRTSAFEPYRRSKYEDELQETDTLSPLPRNQFNENRSDIFERTRGRSLDGKLETLEISGISYERSNSSLEKRFPEMLLSPSMEDFASSVKKRSSDVLEDLRHLESKSTEDGEINPNMLTRKTSFIWEDLKCLEARRQDTFSDSAKEFSRQRIDIPGISISMEGRKTYIVEPKINIDENSDSILKSVTYKNFNGTRYDADTDDDRESKLGVWTKVKPRKRNDNGRRSSDRALKIIQENSAILQKILTCQARKRLPDLEEISKEITISPINEEISKIFSPILEKMGLNEHEINEELARINFKEIDRNTTTTTASEFEAKINDELSKLSLIGDNEEVAYLPDVDDLSSDYFVARDAFIDHQINEELSKLLVNYSEDSPMTLAKNSSHNTISDESLIRPKQPYSYKSSNDSHEMKSNLRSKDSLHSIIYPDKSLSYTSHNNYSKPRDLSTKNDVDIYRELEKINHIPYSQTISPVAVELPQNIVSASKPHAANIVRSPISDFSELVIDKQPKLTSTYDKSPLKSPYNGSYSSTFQSYDYKSRISPRKVPSNPYSVRSYDSKSNLDTGFENNTFELTARKAIVPSTLNYEYGPKKHIISKEHLEFRVKYDMDDNLTKAMTKDIDLKLSPFQTNIAELDRGASYYFDKQVITPTNKYSSGKDNGISAASNFGSINYESTYRKTYDSMSPGDKYSSFCDDYDSIRQPYKITPLDPEAEVSAYLSGTSINSNSNQHRDTHAVSPNYQYNYTKSLSGSYVTASPNLDNSSSSTPTRTKSNYSDSPTDIISYRTSTLAMENIIENQDTKYRFEKSPSPKSLGFSPFPMRNMQRKPKEVAVKLGLYSPTNLTLSKRS